MTDKNDVKALFDHIADDLVEYYESKRKQSARKSYYQLLGALRMYCLLQSKEPNYSEGIAFDAVCDACDRHNVSIRDVYEYVE